MPSVVDANPGEKASAERREHRPGGGSALALGQNGLMCQLEGIMRQPRFRELAAGLAALFATIVARQVVAHEGMHEGMEDHQFQMMDANGDGKVTADEHAAGAKKMFEMMDADRNAKVTAAEMTAAHQRMMGKDAAKGVADKHEMAAAEKIKVVDTNGDGVLTAEEHAAGAKKMFAMMDTDHDGSLTKSELRAGHAKLMPKKEK